MAKVSDEKIIEAAFNMFCEKGYEGTSMRELAASLGIAKASLYKHFKSKEELWSKVVVVTSDYYAGNMSAAENEPPIPQSADEFRKMVNGMVQFTLRDTAVKKMRKLCLTEQFRDEKVRAIATEHFNNYIESRFAYVFAGMKKNGCIGKVSGSAGSCAGDAADAVDESGANAPDCEMMAFALAGPIMSQIHLCDREPGREKEVLERIERFTDHFIELYDIR